MIHDVLPLFPRLLSVVNPSPSWKYHKKYRSKEKVLVKENQRSICRRLFLAVVSLALLICSHVPCPMFLVNPDALFL